MVYNSCRCAGEMVAIALLTVLGVAAVASHAQDCTSVQDGHTCLASGGCMWCTSPRGGECSASGPSISPVWRCTNSSQPAPALPADPTVQIHGGVQMPVVALGTAGYDNATAAAAVKLALASGLKHVHTAFDYFNRKSAHSGVLT